MKETKRDLLWVLLFLIIFINGFEAGGYQASMLEIGNHYDLSTTSKGLFASIELFATMLAPLLLGAWADRSSKRNCLRILLGIQLASSLMILFTASQELFLGGMFFLGLTTSALQFIAIAALADSYPASGKRKIGYMTSMYATGAFIAPLVVNFYLGRGTSWRTLYAILAVGSAVALVWMLKVREGMHETPEDLGTPGQQAEGKAGFILAGVLCLCVVMCIYVGFENGFAYFIDTMFTEVFQSSIGKYALSIFWISMIPSRVLVGRFVKYSYRILMTCVIAIPCITVAIAFVPSSIIVLLLSIPLGFACGAIYPCSLSMLLPFAGKRTATATGMITTATGIGGVVFTIFTGVVGDQWGIRIAMAALSACFLLSFLSVLALRRVARSKNVIIDNNH